MTTSKRTTSNIYQILSVLLVLLSRSDAFSSRPFVSPVTYTNKLTSKYVLSPLWQLPKSDEIVNDTDSSSSETDTPVIKSFDKKIEKLNRDKTKFLEKLSTYDAELQKLHQKKEEYMAKLQVGQPPAGGNFSETTLRSLVKALCWRVIAGGITFFTSLQFSGSIKTALSIVGSDFFSKAFTMFIGERLMNKSQAGRKGGADDAGRSLMKALVWRLFAIANTLTMSLLIAKDLSIASKIAGSDAIFKTALMFVYERVWARIEWGKEYLIEFSI